MEIIAEGGRFSSSNSTYNVVKNKKPPLFLWKFERITQREYRVFQYPTNPAPSSFCGHSQWDFYIPPNWISYVPSSCNVNRVAKIQTVLHRIRNRIEISPSKVQKIVFSSSSPLSNGFQVNNVPILGANKCEVNRLFVYFQFPKMKILYEFVAARGIFCIPVDGYLRTRSF